MTSSGEDISSHHLLLYASKYWDKHFDNIQESPELRTNIKQYVYVPLSDWFRESGADYNISLAS